MRLQDLKDEIASIGEAEYWQIWPTATRTLRRVAGLFDTCLPCEGTGQRGNHPDEVPCRFCERTGAVASPEGRAWFEQYGIGDVRLFPSLARFLFGEG